MLDWCIDLNAINEMIPNTWIECSWWNTQRLDSGADYYKEVNIGFKIAMMLMSHAQLKETQHWRRRRRRRIKKVNEIEAGSEATGRWPAPIVFQWGASESNGCKFSFLFLFIFIFVFIFLKEFYFFLVIFLLGNFRCWKWVALDPTSTAAKQGRTHQHCYSEKMMTVRIFCC